MQYPQIQFYRGSLVRLASGKLKQVEDLSSDDFLESAKLFKNHTTHSRSLNNLNLAQSNNNNNNNNTRQQSSCFASTSHLLDDNNNNTTSTSSSNHHNNSSVFNSPEPTPSFDSSPTIDMMETDDDITNHAHNYSINHRQTHEEQDELEEDEDEELDVVSHCDNKTNVKNAASKQQHNDYSCHHIPSDDEDLYIDSSVVRDFLEVRPPSSNSPTSPSRNLPNTHFNHDLTHHLYPSTSSSTSSSTCSSNSPHSPPASLTVLIKFFLESSRSVVFIEVPIEHPFFVFHRGWSSWNPQRTYDKFGLKCRKLKIGDTCISLIRRKSKLNTKQQQQESDHCNVLFSSIKIKE